MKNSIKILSLLLIIITVTLSAFSVSAAEAESAQMTVLGDSIASGYGLDSFKESYSALIAMKKSYYVCNDAVPGHTTADLLNIVQSNKVARQDITDADFIVISIGGNDLLGLLQNASASELFDIMTNGANSTLVKNVTATAGMNLFAICDELRVLNSDCPIIFQTQYNPMYASEQYSVYADVLDSFAPLFNGLFYSLTESYEEVYAADIYTAFDNYYTENQSYDIIHSDSIHPSAKGHALIAEVLLEEIEKLEEAGKIPVYAQGVFYLLGDADGSGEVTISDATTVQKFMAGLILYSNDVAHLCSDADQSNEVNIKDATAIQKHLAGLDANPAISTYVPYTTQS